MAGSARRTRRERHRVSSELCRARDGRRAKPRETDTPDAVNPGTIGAECWTTSWATQKLPRAENNHANPTAKVGAHDEAERGTARATAEEYRAKRGTERRRGVALRFRDHNAPPKRMRRWERRKAFGHQFNFLFSGGKLPIIAVFVRAEALLRFILII